jgi:four helix bundle protein
MNGKGNQLSEKLLGFVIKVIKIINALPNTVAGRHIGGQLVRSGTSCGSNYEEGCGAESRSDFVHKMSIVLKELKETRFWLRVIHRTGMLANEYVGPVMDECEQLCAIIGKNYHYGKEEEKYSIINSQ